MRILAFLSMMGSIAFVGCAGDTSVLMSVWNDSGVGGAGGGAEGSGGQSGSSISVTGGTRDLTTTQCTATTGGTCPVPDSYLSCIEANCGPDIAACYYSDGVSKAAGGLCMAFGNCMLNCPCDSGRSKCETTCTQNDGSGDPNCWPCLNKLLACSSKYNCTLPTTCTAGSSAGTSP
jgi:hypothetical protein